jgi:hypothetical protein
MTLRVEGFLVAIKVVVAAGMAAEAWAGTR